MVSWLLGTTFQEQFKTADIQVDFLLHTFKILQDSRTCNGVFPALLP